MIPCSEEEYFYKVDNMVLSCTQHLRNVFKKRWRVESGEIWVDEQNCILKFINGLGANVLKKAPSFQKNVLKASRSIEEWDVSLLSLTIQNFGDEKKYEKDNIAVRKLKNMRNDLAHHPTKKFTQDEYNENVKIFKESLQTLNMKGGEINKLIEGAGVTSSLKALERVKALYKNSEHFMKSQNFDEAIKLFTEAITTPSLLPENHGEAYEKRADCYLRSMKSQSMDAKCCNQALLDVKQALELNSSSWNAHYLAAQCYKLKNELSEAIRYYEMTLAISPAQKHVKQDFDSCKVLAGVHYREDHMNPRMMPMNLDERVAHLEKETGIKMTGKQFLKVGQFAGKFIKGQDHVIRGHQYFCGWDVPPNFNEAAKYYGMADSEGNAEGSFNLGLCYKLGRGVKQDVVKAMQIFKRVAKMDKNTLGEHTPLGYNIGVTASQHTLGLMYENGIGVEKNFTEAAAWYKKAMENGAGNAANNLGLLYSKGLGVPLDEKMAEMCWKQGVNLNDVNAADSLVGYYLVQWEPEKAMRMLRIGREMGCARLVATPDDEFKKIIEDIRTSRVKSEPVVIEFEKTHNLQSKGLTFKQRFSRSLNQIDPQLEKFAQITERTMSGKGVCNSGSWGGKAQPVNGEKINIIQQRARDGSDTASQVIQTFHYNFELIALLEAVTETTDAQKLTILELLYNCTVLDMSHVMIFPDKQMQKLKTIVAQLFEKTCGNKGEDDMKIRLCYVTFNLEGSLFSSDDKYALEILKEGVRRYPNNASYYDKLSCCLGFKKMYKEGAFIAEEGLKKFPHDVNLMYNRAVHVRNGQASKFEIIEVYKKFLNAAPVDHRKVPEAYYNISSLYCSDFKRGECNEEMIESIKTWFHRGQEAEKKQLPIYLPYGESDVKATVEILIAGFNKRLLYKRDTNNLTENLRFASVLERKDYLKSPTRRGLLLQYRAMLKQVKGKAETKNSIKTTATPKLKQIVPKKMSQTTPITLIEMNPTDDYIFENSTIDLTIIDEPNIFFVSIALIAEDDNGDVTRLYIYNVKKDPTSLERFQPGCRIAIVNPYMRIGARSISNGIRNDDPRCLIYLEKVEKMCRFCGEENSVMKCSKCKRPYCSRECQTLDWKELDHKSICSL